jgi:hypothetical protein
MSPSIVKSRIRLARSEDHQCRWVITAEKRLGHNIVSNPDVHGAIPVVAPEHDNRVHELVTMSSRSKRRTIKWRPLVRRVFDSNQERNCWIQIKNADSGEWAPIFAGGEV